MRTKLAGIGLMMATVFVFVCMDTLMKHLSQTYPIGLIVWARYTFHFLFFFAVLGRRSFVGTMRSQRPWLQLGRSILLLVSTVLFTNALRYLPLADAVAIGFASPLFIAALSKPLLGELVGRRRWAAVLVGFLGVLVIIRPGSGSAHWAMVLPLGMAVCFALYQIATRVLARTDDALTTLFYSASIGAIATTAALPLSWQMPNGFAWITLVIIGLFGGLGHFLIIKAYERAEAAVLAPFVYTQLIWATLSGYLVFGDIPDRWTVVGAAIIVASGLYVVYQESGTSRAIAGRTPAEGVDAKAGPGPKA